MTRHATFASELDFGQIAKRGNAVYVERVVTFSTSVEPILALYTFLTHLTDVMITTTTITSIGSDRIYENESFLVVRRTLYECRNH